MGLKRRVDVLMGGVGGERTISLKTGRAVASGLREAGHEVAAVDLQARALPDFGPTPPDAVFVALHGEFGEDGSIQQMLEDEGIPYTGSGPRASRLGMDKLASKRLFTRHAIPTADYFSVKDCDPLDRVQEVADQFGYPVVCKPVASGSSLGVTIARGPADLPAALAEAHAHGDTVLVERYVPGREFTVGVLEGQALPVVEMVVPGQFFDYKAKYKDQETRYITPVSLLPTIYRRLTEAVVRAYNALGCRHMARVDCIYGYDATINVLEVNTIPGFTPRSLLPMAAARAGIGFSELCDRLVCAAIRDAAAGRRRRLSA